MLLKWLNDFFSIDWATLLHFLWFLLFKRLNHCCLIDWTTLFCVFSFNFLCSNYWVIAFSINWMTLLNLLWFFFQTIEWLLFNRLNNPFVCLSFNLCFSIDWIIVVQWIELHFWFFLNRANCELFNYWSLCNISLFFSFSSFMFWINTIWMDLFLI